MTIEEMLKHNEQELMEFYAPFFKAKNELKDFFDSVYKLDIDDRIPRQMINQIYILGDVLKEDN